MGDQAHVQAYRGVGLGRSNFCPSYNLHKITEASLSDFVSQYATSDRTTVVGVNVDHKEFVDLVTKEFVKFPKPAQPGKDLSEGTFRGGRHVVPGARGTTLSITYEAKPASRAAYEVLKHVTAHTPPRDAYVYHNSFHSTGLFGIVVSSNEDGQADALYRAVQEKFNELSKWDDAAADYAVASAHTASLLESENGLLCGKIGSRPPCKPSRCFSGRASASR